jgi:hypothetical protein
MTDPGTADLLVSGDGAHRENGPRSRWFFHSSATKIAGAALLLLVLWSFTPPSEPRYRLCGFYWLTGRSCPLCGLTRAVFALAKGNIRQAIDFNALSPLGFTMLFSLFWDHPWRSRLWTVGIAAFAAYGVLRIFVAQA